MIRHILLLFPFLFVGACETTPEKEQAPVAAPAESLKPYSLSTCLVTDEPLGSRNDDRTLFHEGQEVKVCCAACQMTFRMSPEKYLAKLP